MDIPQPGERYHHYKSVAKNRCYEVIAVAQETETRELLVVYKALPPGDEVEISTSSHYWARPLSIRNEYVSYHNQRVKRFTKC